MASITQDMRYRLSLIKYAQKHGVTRAAVKYRCNRQYIYRCFGGITLLQNALAGLIPIKTSIPWKS